MDIDAALKDGYSLAEVNAEAAQRVKFDYAGARKDGYSDEDINQELRKRLGGVTAPKKRDTTLGEDFQIGLGQAGSTVAKGVGLLAGGAASMVDTDTADSIFKGTDELAQSVKDYWTPKDAEQGFGGKVASMVSTLPAQLLAMPFSPADTGMEMINAGETLDKAQTGALLDTAGNVAGLKIPGVFGKGLLSKFVTGAASNAAQDTLVRAGIISVADTKQIQEQFKPTAETAGLAAVLGGPMGMMTPNAHPDAAQKPPADVAGKDPAVERGLMEQGLASAQKDLAAYIELQKELQQRIAEGDASKETIADLQEVEAIVKNYSDEVRTYENILSGKTDIRSDNTADAINARQAELEAREARMMAGSKRPQARELAPGEDAPFPDRVPENWEEVIDTATGEVTKQPKQAPHDVALAKIGEVWNDPRGAAAKLEKVQQALDDLPNRVAKDDTPGSEYSSRKSALELEIKAYTDIIAGRKPDLSGFESKVEPAKEPTSSFEGEVFPHIDPSLLDNAPKTAVEAPPRPQQQAEVPEIPAHILEANAALREMAEKATPKKVSPLERLPDEAYGAEVRKPTYEKEFQPLPDGVKFKPLGAHNWFKNQLQNVQRRLETVNEQLKEQGVDQSGALDQDAPPGMTRQQELEIKRGSLERAEAHLQEVIDRIRKTNPDVKKQLEAKSAADVPVAAVLAEPVQPKKFASVDDLLANSKDENGFWNDHAVRNMDDNPTLFDRMGIDVHIDKRIPRPVQDILAKLLHLTKFMDEKTFFVLDMGMKEAKGRSGHFGNTTIIALNPTKIAENLAGNRKMEGFVKYMGNGKLTEALKTFHTVRYLTHELGHALFNKYLRDSVTHTDDIIALSKQFDDYTKKHGYKVNSVFDIFKQDERLQYQDTFHEFFAERVARQLMHKHILGGLPKTSKLITSIGKLVDNSVAFLENQKIYIDKDDFATNILKDIMNDSKDVIAATSARAKYDVTQLHNDKYILESQRLDPLAFPFYKKTMEDVRGVLQEIPGMVRGGQKFDDIKDLTIQPVFSTNTITRMGHGLTRNIFGKLGASRVFFDDPLIKTTHDHIRNAEVKADEINNKLWYGTIQKAEWASKNFIQRMSKVKLEGSAYWQTMQASPKDLAVVHDLFKQGFEQSIHYDVNKATNGAHLTPKQVKLYDTLAELFKGQYAETVKIEQQLGKKNIMSERPGWYPAVRDGQYFVDISFNGRTLHREQFRSKVEANHFRSIMQQTGAKHVVVSDAQHVKDNQQVSDMYGGLELAQRILEQRFPAAQGAIRQTIQQALQKVITRGGRLGSHHQFRSNIPGYRGTELFYKAEEKGESFRAAIQQSVNDYSGGLRKMMIQHHTDPIFKAQGLDPNAPNVQTAQMMIDSSLNRVSPNTFEQFDRAIVETWDAGVRSLTKEIAPNQKGSFERVNGGLLEFFYLTKLMSKIVFPIGQILTMAGAIRELSVEGGYIRPYIAMAKGLSKIAIGDKALQDTLFDVSQTSNTFEPQFIEALHLGTGGKMLEGVKDYVLLRKVNEAADSFSRMTVFAAAFEMYKDMGMSVQDAKRRAMDDANTTMVPYGRTETAPIFNRMGIIGNAMKPLQTFGQQQLANWIHDFRYMKANDPKSWAPMVNYMLVATALSGAMSPLFIQEYEMIRKILERFFPKWAPPSILELAKHTPDMLDRVYEDPAMVKKAMMYGIPAATTGVDVASSTRSNQTFLTLVGAVLAGEEDFAQLVPHLNTIAGVVGGLATGAKAVLGGNVTNEDTRKALQQVMPAGVANYGAQDYTGVNEAGILGKKTGMVAAGKGNTAQVPLTNTERVAGYMGTKSTEEKYKSDQARYLAAKDVINKQRVERLYDVLMDTPKENEEKVREIFQKLVDLGQDNKAISSKLSTEMYHRYMPMLNRMVMDKKGKVSTNKTNLEKLKEIQQFSGR